MYLQSISNKRDYDALKNHIIEYGNHIEENGGYKEIDAVIEMNPLDVIPLLNSFCSENNYSVSDLISKIDKVIRGEEDFNEIPESDYAVKDYTKKVVAFLRYIEDNEFKYRTNRQFVYHMEEESCFNSFQFFPYKKQLIIHFRSCDLIHKFIPDVLLLLLLCNTYNVDIMKFTMVFGSLHIYDKDVER